MSGATDTAMLVDADNVSAALVDEVLRQLRKVGASVGIRRAYGGHEKLAGMKEALRRNAFRIFVNHGNGTTDVALAIDAMDLLHGGALPSNVVIVSSDADFAALAVRLREEGIRAVCFAHRLAADADALARVYDEVVFDDEVLPAAETAAGDAPPPLAAAVAPEPLRARPAAQTPPLAAAAKEDVEAVRRILTALPAWRVDTVRQLNQIGTPLREAGIKAGSKPLHELFRKHPSYFKVMPTTGHAKQVKLLKLPRESR